MAALLHSAKEVVFRWPASSSCTSDPAQAIFRFISFCWPFSFPLSALLSINRVERLGYCDLLLSPPHYKAKGLVKTNNCIELQKLATLLFLYFLLVVCVGRQARPGPVVRERTPGGIGSASYRQGKARAGAGGRPRVCEGECGTGRPCTRLSTSSCMLSSRICLSYC